MINKIDAPYTIKGDHLSNLDKDVFREINDFYEINKNIINASETFPLFIRRQSLSYYLAKYSPTAFFISETSIPEVGDSPHHKEGMSGIILSIIRGSHTVRK